MQREDEPSSWGMVENQLVRPGTLTVCLGVARCGCDGSLVIGADRRALDLTVGKTLTTSAPRGDATRTRRVVASRSLRDSKRSIRGGSTGRTAAVPSQFGFVPYGNGIGGSELPFASGT